MRSGRVPATAPTVAAVISPSPMPISACRPTMRAKTVPREAPPAPPSAYSTTKASEATTVLTKAAVNATASRPRRLRWAIRRSDRATR